MLRSHFLRCCFIVGHAAYRKRNFHPALDMMLFVVFGFVFYIDGLCALNDRRDRMDNTVYTVSLLKTVMTRQYGIEVEPVIQCRAKE